MNELDDKDEFIRTTERSKFERWIDKILRKFGFHVCRIDPAACDGCARRD